MSRGARGGGARNDGARGDGARGGRSRGGRPPRSAAPGRGDRSGGTPGGPPARGGSSRAGGRGGQGRRGPDRAGRGGSRADKGLGGSQVEGRQAVRELLLAGRRRVREVVVATEADRGGVVGDIVELARELRVPVREVGRSKLDSLSRTDAPQGVVAIADELPATALADLVAPVGGRPPFLLACDGVTDPGNLGAVLRTAECCGVTGVVLPRHRAVHVTPAVTKAAAGAVEHLPLALAGGLPAALAELSAAGVWVVGLDADGTVHVADLPVADGPVCLVLGAEGTGLSRLVRERCDVVASIPLEGRLGSLNVAAAAAIACYEVARHR